MCLLKRITCWIAVAALGGAALSACGIPTSGGAAQRFIRGHTACPQVYYEVGPWLGERIYYAVSSPTGYDIHSMNAYGGNDQLLVRNARNPLPSPDGERLAFKTHPGTIGPDTPEGGLLDLATGEITDLKEMGNAVSWSPDSRWIAYSPWGGPVMKRDVISGQIVTLDQTPEPHNHSWYPMWSPGPSEAGDGTQIVFVSDRDGPNSLYLIDAESGAVSRLTRDKPSCSQRDDFDQPLAWRPDGGALAYISNCTSNWSLRAVRLITPGGVALAGWDDVLAPFYLNDWSMEWSRDGRRVLLSDGLALYVANGEPGSGPREVRQKLDDPHWSPDGRQIVFEAQDRASQSQIYVMDADGAHVTQLTNNSGAKVCLH